jgi:3'(2'), 5'-bisphosphate nucleotidase
MSMSALLSSVIALSKQAGQAILAVYHDPTVMEVVEKSDHSPLTTADLAAHHCIVRGLQQLTPDWPILSEESKAIDFSTRQQWQRYWLVDPLDGTKEFIQRNGEFTVNIALIDNHQPVLGVVYVPVTDVCYYAEQGQGAYKQVQNNRAEFIHCQPCRHDHLRIMVSRRHGERALEKFLATFPRIEKLSMGSSLKFCMIAEGKADLYPRLGLTSEWDTAAAQCVVEQAGGQVLSFAHNTVLSYNTKDSLLNPYFLVSGDPTVNWLQQRNYSPHC